MEQVIFGGFPGTLDDTATEYNSLVSGYNWQAAENIRIVSTGGKIKNLRVKLDGAPGAGKSYAFTLMVDGSPTALTLTISESETSGSDATEITVFAGQTVSLRCIPSGTPTVRTATWTTVFEGDTANESLILGGSNVTLHSVDIEYSQIMTSFGSVDSFENNHRQVIPTAGTIKNLYVKLSEHAGTNPDAYRFTLRLANAGNSYTLTDTALTVTITATATTGNNTANSIAVVAGDFITLKIEPLNTPSVTPVAYWGMTFVADTDGESIVLGGSYDDLDNAATEYSQLVNFPALDWTASEDQRYQLGQACILKKLYMLLSAAPGAGKKYTFTVRIAGASNVVAEVAGTATTGNSSTLEDTVADDEYVSLQVVPDSTPDAVDAYWGLVSTPLAVVVPPGGSPMSQLISAGII